MLITLYSIISYYTVLCYVTSQACGGPERGSQERCGSSKNSSHIENKTNITNT